MRMRTAPYLAFILLLTAGPFPISQARQPSVHQALTGTWTGVLEVQGIRLHLVLDLKCPPEGACTGDLDSIDQGARDIPIARITIQDRSVTLDLPRLMARYTGRLSPDGKRLEGTWQQAGRSFPLTFEKTEKPFEPAPAGPYHPKLGGYWVGYLEISGMRLRVVFGFDCQPEKGCSGTLDSPDQGAFNIPIAKIEVKDDQIILRWPALRAVFKGEIAEAGKVLKGTWTQAGQSLSLTLKHQKEKPVFRRPQDPVPPYPYHAEEVTFPGGNPGVTLAGTLTYPRTGGPFPGVVLVSGSGPQDRNETVFGHRPFLVLADALTRRGIAVLRYDDRGTGRSTGTFATATTRDFAADARAALEFIKQRREIDPQRVGLIGHSEGGIIAPMVAAQSEDVAFIVLIAGPAVPGEELLYLQSELIARASGRPERLIRFNRVLEEKLFARLKKGGALPDLERDLRKILENALKGLSEADRKELNLQEGAIEAQVRMLLSPWFRFFLTYDPRPTLQQVRCPLLAVYGENDLQVPPRQNIPPLVTALEEGGHPDYTVVKLARLNHLLQTSKTGTPQEYSQIEETIAPVALDTIADWILRHTR